MCIGIPMQVIQHNEGQALCRPRDSDTVEQIDMLLVGEVAVGSWVMVFLGAAREVLDEITAHQISDALQALNMAMQGDAQVDHLFADLIDREPQLPEFLQSQLQKG